MQFPINESEVISTMQSRQETKPSINIVGRIKSDNHHYHLFYKIPITPESPFFLPLLSNY